MMVGCGGAVAETEQEATLETREDAIPDCSASGATYNIYYSDATYTTQVGGRGCDCGFYGYWGKSTTFRQTFYDYCSP
ncbi:hypothetical protein [Cystobacter fuscus]|uniref:hypothetical protein n=1 Tax=Cystobacter fuscus TaxID=43 RepID=UPI002B27E63D|nr:hypothetical protein F0U63_07615 [Cystobacter fuscus]